MIATRNPADRSEWKPSPILFQKSVGLLSMDLFASRLSSQLPLLVGWKLGPLAVATVAFTQDWNTLVCQSSIESDRLSLVCSQGAGTKHKPGIPCSSKCWS